MLKKSNSLLDLLTIIDDLLLVTQESYIHSLYYWKKEKSLIGPRNVKKHSLELRKKLLKH